MHPCTLLVDTQSGIYKTFLLAPNLSRIHEQWFMRHNKITGVDVHAKMLKLFTKPRQGSFHLNGIEVCSWTRGKPCATATPRLPRLFLILPNAFFVGYSTISRGNGSFMWTGHRVDQWRSTTDRSISNSSLSWKRAEPIHSTMHNLCPHPQI